MNRELLISTGIACSVLCSYCPQTAIGRAYKRRQGPKDMTLDTFETCLKKLPPDVVINFTGFYEPFLNQDCTQMIHLAVARGHRVRLSTTVMGLTADQVVQLRGVPFIKFAVHLPDARGLTRIRTDDTYMAALDALLEGGISGLGFHVHVGENGPEPIEPAVQARLDAAGIAPENRWLITRAGNIDIAGRKTPGRIEGRLKLCPRLRHNVLMPNGDVALCCMDWRLKHVIGNLVTESYDALFQSDEYRRVLRGYADDSLDILCRTCEKAVPEHKGGQVQETAPVDKVRVA